MGSEKYQIYHAMPGSSRWRALEGEWPTRQEAESRAAELRGLNVRLVKAVYVGGRWSQRVEEERRA